MEGTAKAANNKEGFPLAMGGLCVIGLKGRHQPYVPGRDPSHRKKAAGNKGQDCRERYPGGRCGVGNLGTSAWLDGGGEGPLGGEGRRAPVAVGAVMTDREKALKVMEVLKTVLGESAGNSREELVREQIPPGSSCLSY